MIGLLGLIRRDWKKKFQEILALNLSQRASQLLWVTLWHVWHDIRFPWREQNMIGLLGLIRRDWKKKFQDILALNLSQRASQLLRVTLWQVLHYIRFPWREYNMIGLLSLIRRDWKKKFQDILALNLSQRASQLLRVTLWHAWRDIRFPWRE